MENSTAKVNPFSPEMQRIINSLRRYYENHIHPKWVEAYKNYLLYSVDRQVLIEDFQTNVKMPIVKMYVDTMWTSIYDNDFEFRVSGRSSKDHKKADKVLNFMSWAFSVSKSRPEFMSAIKEALIIGNGYGRVNFFEENKVISYRRNGIKKEYEVKNQYPYMEYVSAFNLYFDPTAKSIYDSKYAIERQLIHKDGVLKQILWLLWTKDEKKHASAIEEALRHPWYAFSWDFDRVKYLAFWDNQLVDNRSFSSISNQTTADTGDFNAYYKNWLTPNYEGGYGELLKYWEDDKLVFVFNGRELYSGENPLPIKRKPYFQINYNPVPGMAFGQGMATSLEDMQKLADTIFNLFADNMKMQVAPMFTKLKGGDSMFSGGDVLSYSPFKVVETNSPDAIQRMNLGTQDFSGGNFLDYIFRLCEMSEGVNSYAIGYQDKIERSATGVSARVQSFKSRLMPLHDSMNQALTWISEMWTGFGVALMDEEIEIKISQENTDEPWFLKMSMDDLLGQFDLQFDAQALKTATRETRRRQFTELMQTAMSAGQDPSTGQYFVDMRELWKKYLDTFELPAEDIVMEAKDVIRKQNAVQIIQKKEGERMAAKLGTPAPGAAIPGLGVTPLPWEEQVSGAPSGIEALLGAGTPPVESTESEILNEAYGQ